MITNKTLYTLDDLCIVPSTITNIKSRSECNQFDNNQMLPIFNAPMASIIDTNNINIFKELKINTILPRNIDIKKRLVACEFGFVALSLDEFEEFFIENDKKLLSPVYICVDVANGHMLKLIELCKKAKKIHRSMLTLMAGNIANPRTYNLYCDARVDYVRFSVGSGNCCSTSVNTGIHYPIASLINECKSIKTQRSKNKMFSSKIIADGGFNTYGQIIKALGLGADYVMLGRMFAACEECSIDDVKLIDNVKYSKYYGMSTEYAQKLLNPNKPLKTSEGVYKLVEVNNTLLKFTIDFSSYLKSAMSYCNCKELNEFIGKVNFNVISNNSFKNYDK